MKLGLFGINFGLCATPTRWCASRGRGGRRLDSVWTGEHVVLPDPQAPPSPRRPRTPLLDPAVALALLAAHTQRIRLGTGIIILPQRNPVVLAKELASLDVVSNGRLIFGLGAGYLEPEFHALGAPFAERGARTDEYIDAIARSGRRRSRASRAATFASRASTRSRARCRSRTRRSWSAA